MGLEGKDRAKQVTDRDPTRLSLSIVAVVVGLVVAIPACVILVSTLGSLLPVTVLSPAAIPPPFTPTPTSTLVSATVPAAPTSTETRVPPTETPVAEANETPITTGGETTTHILRYGDTLFSVAQRYGTTVYAIRAANGLTSDFIIAGQELTIPVGSPAPSTGTPGAIADPVAPELVAQLAQLEKKIATLQARDAAREEALTTPRVDNELDRLSEKQEYEMRALATQMADLERDLSGQLDRYLTINSIILALTAVVVLGLAVGIAGAGISIFLAGRR